MLAPLLPTPRPALLSQYPVFTSRDIDQARDLVGQNFCAHDLQQTGAAQQLDCRFHRVGLGELALNYLCYGADVNITPGCLEQFYLVQIPLSGQAIIDYGAQRTLSDRNTAVILSPHQPISMHWQGESAQVLLYIPRATMQRHATEVLGQSCDQLDFRPALAQRGAATAGWCQMVVDLAHNIDHNGIGWLQHAAAAASLQDILLHGLLTLQPYKQGKGTATVPTAQPRHVTRACDYIDNHADQPLTVAQIAGAACISVRALEEGFRRHLGCTPMVYLREKRLALAHDSLRKAARDGLPTTLSDIAYQHGFFHLGRFAAYYKARFGKSPSATLKG